MNKPAQNLVMKLAELPLQTRLMVTCAFLIVVPVVLYSLVSYRNLILWNRNTMQAETTGIVKGWQAAALLTVAQSGADEAAKGRLIKAMQGQKIRDRGYVWVLSGDGKYIVSSDGLRDGENLLASKDKEEVATVKRLISEAKSAGVNRIALDWYKWQNTHDQNPQEKLAAMVFIPEWDWIIGASTYSEDYSVVLAKQLQQNILIAIFSVILGLLTAYLITRAIIHPLIALEKSSLQASKGDMDIQFDESLSRGGKEISSLARSIYIMISNLKLQMDLLNRKLDLERLTSSVSASFNEKQNSNEAIMSALAKVAEATKATGASLIFSATQKSFSEAVHEWVSDEKYSLDVRNRLDLNQIKEWREILLSNEAVIVNSVESLSEVDVQESEYMKRSGIKSLLAIPFMIDGKMAGTIDVKNHNEARDWTDRDIITLRTAAEIFGNSLFRSQIKEELQKSKEFLSNIVDAIPDPLFAKDSEHRFVMANTLLANIAGVSVDALIGKNDYDFFPKEQSDIFWNVDQQVLESGVENTNEENLTGKDGKTSTIVTKKARFISKHGKPYIVGVIRDITNIKQAEAKEREQKELIQKVISNIPEHVFWKDKNSIYLGCNDWFAKVAGLHDPREIVGKSDYDLVWTKEEARKYRADDAAVMASRQAKLNFIETQFQADGKSAVVSTSKVPLFNDSNEVVGVLGMYSDITNQVNNEKRLAESEAMFRVTTNAIKEGITLSDESGVFYVYNQEMELLTGYTMDEANRSENFHALLHPDDIDVKKEIVGKIAEYKIGQRYLSDTNIKTKNGDVRNFQVATVVIEHLHNRMFLSAYSDITKLKNTEAALIVEKATVERKVADRTNELQKETRKVHAILQSIGDGVFVLDSDKKILLSNRVTEELSGYSESELRGSFYRDHLKFVFEKNEEENVELVDTVYRDGVLSFMSNHTKLIRKDGSSLSVADSAAPLKDDIGKVIGCVVVFRDVTKERDVERMKDEFISIASHQLRTPLTALRWLTEIMEKPTTGVLNETQAELISDMRVSTKRLIMLVNDLLNISRIESGTIMVDPVPTNIPEMIASVIHDLKIRLDGKKQECNVEIPKSVPMMTVDPKLVRQLYHNLLSNASKYSTSSSVIKIRLSVEGEFLKSEVIDTGYGVPEAQKNRIFQKFFRANNILQKDSDGTGLGLYLVKMIAEASGGKAGFESKEAEGSTFWFTLPLKGSTPQKGETTLT